MASEPEQVGRRDVHEEFPTELTRLNLAWRTPGLTHADTPALRSPRRHPGHGRSSLLNQDLREKQQIVHSVSAGIYAPQMDGIFAIQALCDPDKREQAEKAAFAIVEKVKKDGVTAAELEKARRSLLSSQLSNLDTSNGKASDLGSNWQLTKNLNFSKDYLNAIAKVTPADIQRVAASTSARIASTSRRSTRSARSAEVRQGKERRQLGGEEIRPAQRPAPARS